jgi:hypothetical protein
MKTSLKPALIVQVRKQVVDWNKELLQPWEPSQAARNLAQTVRNNCPKMAAELEAAEILESWAEMLHDRIWDLMLEFRKQGRPANEAMSQAMMELVPASDQQEKEWLAANSSRLIPQGDQDTD